jgi:hypothetical protein
MADVDAKKANSLPSEAVGSLLQHHSRIKLKDVEIYPQNIVNLEVREWIFDLLPRIEVMFKDNGIWFDKFPIEENDVIEATLAIIETQDEPVKNNFVVQAHEQGNTSQGEITASILRVFGYLETKNMYSPLINKSFRNKNSSEVIEQIAKDIELEADIRVNTVDAMTWLQLHMNNSDMIRHVIDNGYVNDDDALFCYATRDSKLVVTSFKKEIKKDAKFVARFSPENSANPDKAPNTADGGSDTNKDDQKIIFYNDYRFSDQSGLINQKIGYGSRIYYYDYESGEQRQITIDDDTHDMTTNSLKTKERVGDIVYAEMKDIQPINVHDNYLRASLQNKYMKHQFFSSYLMLTAKADNSIELFDKVIVNLPQQDEEGIDAIHSGEYLIIGITHQISSEGLYYMLLTLGRNGINAKESVIEDFETKLN